MKTEKKFGLFSKMKKYPKDYKGPKAGQSDTKAWIAVRDYDAFKYIQDGTWTYADFDCYLHSMCQHFYKLGGDATHEAFKAMHKICNIKDQP